MKVFVRLYANKLEDATPSTPRALVVLLMLLNHSTRQQPWVLEAARPACRDAGERFSTR
jgi:hypothetical protein